MASRPCLQPASIPLWTMPSRSATVWYVDNVLISVVLPQVKKVDLPAPAPNFEDEAQGRRDPFISLVNRGKDQRAQNGAATAERAEGIPGMLTAELTVRGIMQTRGAWVAMVSGPDGRVYIVHAGDKLADGVVRQVTAASVVILQEVHDCLSLERQREVRKFLRGGDEVK